MIIQFNKPILHLSLFLFATSVCLSASRHVLLTSEGDAWAKELKKEVNQQLKSNQLTDTLFVDLKEGTYAVNEAFKFSGSTKPNAPIVITGQGKVVLSGGKSLNSKLFAPISDKKVQARIISQEAQSKVLEFDLKKNGVTDLGEIKCIGFQRNSSIAPPQLFYNGELMTLARYPNAGDKALLKNRTTVIPIKKIIDPGIDKVTKPVETGTASKTPKYGIFEYTDPRVEKWSNAKDVWLDGIFTRDWSWSLNRIGKLDVANKTIQLDFMERYDLTSAHSFFFATNLLEELDVPGEYYIDRENGKLYFYPPEDYNKQSRIELSYQSEPFFELKKLTDFSVKNVSFQLGRGTAVVTKEVKSVSFSNCQFLNFGVSALNMDGNENKIENCVLRNIGATAISLNGGNSETLQRSNNWVKNCDISNWAYYDRVYTPAIDLKGVGNNVIANKLYDAPHGAIVFAGNNHNIEKNEISNVLIEFKDFGAIYAFLGKNQLMRGDTIRGNYFHDIGAMGDQVFAIYADEASSGWTIDNNIFYKIGNVKSRVAAVYGNTCTHVHVKNNLFLDCRETFDLSFHFYSWGKNRLDYFTKNWTEQFGNEGKFSPVYLKFYPELKTLMKDERVLVTSNSFTSNTIANFNLPLGHKNFFNTRNGPADSDKYVSASDNKFIEDKSLPTFLDSWNQSSNRSELLKSIPASLLNYSYFKK